MEDTAKNDGEEFSDLSQVLRDLQKKVEETHDAVTGIRSHVDQELSVVKENISFLSDQVDASLDMGAEVRFDLQTHIQGKPPTTARRINRTSSTEAEKARPRRRAIRRTPDLVSPPYIPDSPNVSIVMPVHNDEEWVAGALESCLAQTWTNFEVICVDDASTDGTCSVIEQYQERDSRIKLFKLPVNQSAFQARRRGIFEAKAPYLLFLDGDDELSPEAVRLSLGAARESGADLVGFGVEVTAASGNHPRQFESGLQPKHEQLLGEDILPALFPPGKVAQAHIWRYLWSTNHLRQAYNRLPPDLVLPRANDFPIVFLAVALACRYVSIRERLYRYQFRRGGSGSRAVDAATFDFYLSALDSVDVIAGAVQDLAQRRSTPERLLVAFESARLSAIQVILRYWRGMEPGESQSTALEQLVARVGVSAVLQSAATFFQDVLPQLALHRDELEISPVRQPVRTVLIATGNLSSGGVQGVVVSQAQYLRRAGFKVVIALRSAQDLVHQLPDDVPVLEIAGDTAGDKLTRYTDICREYEVDLAIDHWILYRYDWPFMVLAARSMGIPTIGWLHNFALRPVFDFNTRASFLEKYLPLLKKVVTLSEADVAYWKLRGLEQAVYLPNPPSPLLLERVREREEPRSLGRGPIQLVWWGRLQEHTKRVRDLIKVARELRNLEIAAHLTIIGPDSRDLTRDQLQALAEEGGIDDMVSLPGALHGTELEDALEDADIYVCTSAIEGYPLTLIEAQAMGLPVAMYELPWLVVAQANDGMVTAPQGDARGLARKIAEVCSTPEQYRKYSHGSLEAATQALQHDFEDLYSRLVLDDLAPEFSPAPSLDHAKLLLDHSLSFHEQNSIRERRYSRRVESEKRQLRRKISRLQRK